MKDDAQNPDSTIQNLKRLARKALASKDNAPTEPPVPELSLFRVPSTRQTLIEEGRFSAEEIEILDQMAATQADPEAEQTAIQAKQRFVSGVRFDETTSKSKPSSTDKNSTK